MISADVKLMQCKTKRNKGTGRQAVTCIFVTKSTMYCVSKDMCFSINFFWDSVQNRIGEGEEGYLTEKIC